MSGVTQPDFDLVGTGWIRILPEPAYRAVTSLQALRRRPVRGDLDALVAAGHVLIAGDGLDVPFNPVGRLERADDDAQWTHRWERFGAYAARLGRPMDTPRDAIELLRAVNVVERIGVGGDVFWRSVAPVPLAEDVLPLSAEERTREARVRWMLAFEAAERRVSVWLAEQPGGALTYTSLARLAARLSLDVEDVRYGLAHAIEHHGTVACVPAPEAATPTEPLAIAFAAPVSYGLATMKKIATRTSAIVAKPPTATRRKRSSYSADSSPPPSRSRRAS
jgi:hypothetical protein